MPKIDFTKPLKLTSSIEEAGYTFVKYLGSFADDTRRALVVKTSRGEVIWEWQEGCTWLENVPPEPTFVYYNIYKTSSGKLYTIPPSFSRKEADLLAAAYAGLGVRVGCIKVQLAERFDP